MQYLLNLTMANPAFDGTLRQYTDDLEAAITWFNEQSVHTRNPKSLQCLQIQDSLLVLELTTKVALPAPAKALRLFTQHLLRHSPLGQYVYHNCLFKSVRLAQNVPTTPQALPPEVQVMDALTRMLAGCQPHGAAYFGLFKTVLDCSRDMEEACLKQYLAEMQACAADKARALGHPLPETL